jgi:hypothetical protein
LILCPKWATRHSFRQFAADQERSAAEFPRYQTFENPDVRVATMSPVDDVIADLDDAITNFTQSWGSADAERPSRSKSPLRVSMNCGHTVKTLMIQI